MDTFTSIISCIERFSTSYTINYYTPTAGDSGFVLLVLALNYFSSSHNSTTKERLLRTCSTYTYYMALTGIFLKRSYRLAMILISSYSTSPRPVAASFPYKAKRRVWGVGFGLESRPILTGSDTMLRTLSSFN